MTDWTVINMMGGCLQRLSDGAHLLVVVKPEGTTHGKLRETATSTTADQLAGGAVARIRRSGIFAVETMSTQSKGGAGGACREIINLYANLTEH